MTISQFKEQYWSTQGSSIFQDIKKSSEVQKKISTRITKIGFKEENVPKFSDGSGYKLRWEK